MKQAPAINYSTSVGANSTLELEHRFDRAGVVKRVYSAAYAGEETDVRRYFYLWRGGKEAGNRVNLLTTADSNDNTADSYLAGDDQIWNLDTRREFAEGDVLQVKYENTADYEYPVNTVIGIDHSGGIAAQLGGFL